MTRRTWVRLATAGCALVVLTFVAVLLTLVDKQHFGWMVGSGFLVVVSSGVMIGALLVLIATLMLPERKTWRGIVLIAWAAIALTSPLFGYLFLLPWGLLALSLPLVIVILVALYR